MKTAYDLLLDAPQEQTKRCQIAYNAIAQGLWADAAFSLRNAAREETGEWANDADELADYCEEKAK